MDVTIFAFFAIEILQGYANISPDLEVHNEWHRVTGSSFSPPRLSTQLIQ